MNILQVISDLNDSDAARDTIASTRFLTLNGHKAIVVSPKSPAVNEIDEVGARHYNVAISTGILAIPSSIMRLIHIISKENINIVHAKDEISAFIAFFATRFTGKKFVSTLYRPYIRGFFNKALLWARRIVCFNEYEARRLIRKYGVPHDRIMIVSPFIDINKAVSPEERYKADDHFIIGVLLPPDSFESAQNLIKAVSIASRTAYKIKVIIATDRDADKDYLHKINLLIKRHSLDNIVRIEPMGNIRLTKDLKVLVQINDKNGNISFKALLEAQAAGIPLITTYLDGIDNYVKDSVTGIVSVSDAPQEVADKMLLLYKDGDLRDRISLAAKNFAVRNFNIREAMKRMLELYEDVLASTNILIIKIGALGDAILVTPSVRAVHERFKWARIKILTGIYNKEVFLNSPSVSEVIVYDNTGRDKGFQGLWRIGRRLRAENFDMAIDFQNNKKSHILSFLSCAPKRYGYDNGKLSFLLNRKISDAKTPMDPVEHQSKILGLLGIYNIDKRPEIHFTEEDKEWTDIFLKSHWIKESVKLAAFNIGSSPRWATKLWPVEYFAEVCNRLARSFGIRVILIGAEKTTPRTEEFLKRTKGKPINASGSTNISRLASLIKKCDILLSSDSAPIHIAAAVGTPFLALFGPTDPSRHALPGKNHKVIRKKIPCSPCYNRYCNKGYLCMRSIKPDEVCKEIAKMLGLRQERSRAPEKEKQSNSHG